MVLQCVSLSGYIVYTVYTVFWCDQKRYYDRKTVDNYDERCFIWANLKCYAWKKVQKHEQNAEINLGV